MKIEVHSIESVIPRYKDLENSDKKYAIISIVSPGKHSPCFSSSTFKNCMGILNLRFYDTEKFILQGKIRPISEYQAKKIISFFNHLLYSEKVNFLLVHCEAGISRSAGVAAALSKIYYEDNTYFFEKYSPNMYVYSLILNLYSKKAKEK